MTLENFNNGNATMSEENLASRAQIIYPGYGQPPKFGSAIANTEEARKAALDKGATAFTTMAFEHEPGKKKPEPKRFGSLWIDLDDKETPELAVIDAKKFASALEMRYGVNPRMLRFWLSGSKGCHIEVPEIVFGGTGGHTHLPFIHRNMIQSLILLPDHPLSLPTWDRSLYCMGKGKLLREQNVIRDNGRYKVPVSYAELTTLTFDELVQLTHSPRLLPEGSGVAPSITPLAALYETCCKATTGRVAEKSLIFRQEACEECAFIVHCRENSATLSEPEWFAMVTNLVRLGNGGKELIHEYSKDHPEYTKAETDDKIKHALSQDSPHSCAHIKMLFDCGKDCGVKSPVSLYQMKVRDGGSLGKNRKYRVEPDGLYYLSNPEGTPWVKEKICSPIEVIAKSRTPEGTGWGRLCCLTSPDGWEQEVSFLMSELSTADCLRAQLMDRGLELVPGNVNKARLIEYLQTAEPNRLLCQVSKLGWHGNVFVLPDQVFGTVTEEEFRYQDKKHPVLFNSKGTCEEWREAIGKYCAGNPLLILACSYAFVGPLLKHTGNEGGGLHIHGASSTGKTTLMNVAGSICGGGPEHGFKRQWRTTSNGLEAIAVQHNDNLMCLDEIGQAGQNVVSDVAYMLTNGQGKARADRHGNARSSSTWSLVFLSTGEITLNDKIRQDTKTSAMAGQLVRVLDIPADAKHGLGIFANLHDFASGAELSRHLNQASKRYYGAPLRFFLERLTENLGHNIDEVRTTANEFQQKNLPEGCSPQVERVCARFGLLAAAGELAISFGILPLTAGSAIQAAKDYFAIWTDERGSIGDMEVESAFVRLKEFIELHAENRFISLDDSSSPYPPHNLAGYRWTQEGKRYYLILSPVCKNEILNNCPSSQLRRLLLARGAQAVNAAGNPMETKAIPSAGKNVRGLIVIPKAWEEKEDDLLSHASTHAQPSNGKPCTKSDFFLTAGSGSDVTEGEIFG